ncbi:Uridine phosphorylase 1 [Chionoecetes opilio]|uniref:Uridine phosphorylase 1 n=1 Tax=Chionoecetes opilio TaxID=41210 RepID=A0A8J4Y0I4_CHIOP|nr:Uridine phosphorylase 1 [Chionoecetes opilio]
MARHELQLGELPYDPLEEEEEEEQANEDGASSTRHEDGTLRLRNPHIAEMGPDILYHLGLGSGSHDLQDMFGDVRFVCMGGTSRRMEQFAYYIKDEIGYKFPPGTTLLDNSGCCMYKVGPVLCFSHGMGIPSVGILLHEVIKLMYHARCRDPVFFRLGTCGGIGIDGGNLVISESAVDGLLRPYLDQLVLGKIQRRPAILDPELANDLMNLRREDDPPSSGTLGQDHVPGRVDGAFCEYTEADKLAFLQKIHGENVVNMEMESLGFAAFCYHAGPAQLLWCVVAMLDRLQGDQVQTSKEVMNKWQEYPQVLVARYIRKAMGLPPSHTPEGTLAGSSQRSTGS